MSLRVLEKEFHDTVVLCLWCYGQGYELCEDEDDFMVKFKDGSSLKLFF